MEESAVRDTVLVLGAFLVAAWVAPLWPSWTVTIEVVLGTAAVIYVLWRVRADGVDRRGLGVRADNLIPSILLFGALTSLVLAFLVPASGGSPFPEEDEVLPYFLWALFQQFLVVGCFWRHLRGTAEPSFGPWGREVRAAFLAAGIFAFAHAPNPGLMALVFVGEALWLFVFARLRNLFGLALAHTVAALIISHALVPSPWLPSMRVGLAYFRR